MRCRTEKFINGDFITQQVRQCGKSKIRRKLTEKAFESYEKGEEEFEFNVGFVENSNGLYTIGDVE